MEQLTIEALNTQLTEYKAELEIVKKQAQDDSHKDTPKQASLRKAMDEEDPKKKEAAIRKAMDDMKEEKKAEDEVKKDSPKEAAIKSAMDEDDSEKRKAAVKKAMEMKDEEKTAEDEEKKEMKAELLSLRHEAALPKLTRLASIYKNSKIEESKYKELTASWLKMSVADLNSELERVEPFISEHVASNDPTDIPVSQTKDMFSFEASTTKSDKINAIDSAKSTDLFNQKRGMF